MRVLPDENVRSSFAAHLTGHEVDHVDALGLKGLVNGKLLDFARANCDAFVTLDRGVLFQQRHTGPLRVLVVRVPNSTIESLMSRADDVLSWLQIAKPGTCAEI